nr:hypothetical protein Iba_chr05aCG0690 [Ipomoea batatas]
MTYQLSQITCVLLASGEESRKDKFIQARSLLLSVSSVFELELLLYFTVLINLDLEMAGNMPNNILHDFPVSNA